MVTIRDMVHQDSRRGGSRCYRVATKLLDGGRKSKGFGMSCATAETISVLGHVDITLLCTTTNPVAQMINQITQKVHVQSVSGSGTIITSLPSHWM